MAGDNRERHTLLDISLAGRRRILEELTQGGREAGVCGPLLLPEEFGRLGEREPGVTFTGIPGIVRREDFHPRPGFIPLGFSSWASGPHGRTRLATFAAPDEVKRSRTPVEVLEVCVAEGRELTRTPALRAVAALTATGFERARWGVWGSVGLELATGIRYTHDRSDLDLLLVPDTGPTRALCAAWLRVTEGAEKRFGIRIDAEIRLANGYDVSLKECAQGGVKVLAKGLQDVRLLPVEEFLPS